MQSMRPPESNQETSGLEPLSHTFAGPSRMDTLLICTGGTSAVVLVDHGAKELVSPCDASQSSIALLAPDSHRRHVCRCYAGNRWLTQLADFRPR